MKDNGSLRAAEIAKGLSEAQAYYVKVLSSDFKGYHPHSTFPENMELWEPKYPDRMNAIEVRLTPLGEQVRAILSEPSS